ncbi:hypothetical protein NC651_017797 [Populus alba x Populus x berolinensis]|nr:hypothetical protein NC651_017797 [Populus alba x Populus x berolinensis]
MIMRNLIMKHMLAYLSTDQIKYVIIRIIVEDSSGEYVNIITYILFYIFMNLEIFTCIILFSLRTKIDNIRDYIRLYTKDLFLTLSLYGLD